jgi:STAM-binding protein
MNADVNRCRATAIEYLHSVPTLKDRMFAIWQKGEWTTDENFSRSTTKAPLKIEAAKYPSADSVFPQPIDSAKYSSNESLFPPTSLYPSLNATQKPSYPAFTPVDYTPSGQSTPTTGLSIPFDLAETFQRISDSNTKRGIETCGVLLGYKQPDGLLLTTIVIPKQTGTRDTCEALPGAEEQILTYALSNELVCLGWIHTHPSQSCFLSSIDLHTTLPYQQMLPEAVAIVVAPTDDKLPIGVFRLSTIGLGVIRKCPKRGFHNHDVDGPLFHVVKDVNWDPTLNTVVVDLRR